MKLHNIIFPKYGVCSDYSLYFRLNNGNNYSYANKWVYFNDGDYGHFDTYFNALFVSKWKKYTIANSFCLHLTFKGSFRITILHKQRLQDGSCTNDIVGEYEVRHECISEEIIALPDVDQGMIAFSLYSFEKGSVLHSGYYSSGIDPKREINIGVCICTYKREEYVHKNLDNLKKFIDPMIVDRVRVVISDNAGTIPIKSSSNTLVVHNKNAGGAGGFTRCLIELINHPEFKVTHALLMDDDIVFDPEVLLRTYSLLSTLKDEYSGCCVSGGMLRADTQNIQTESGAIWNKGNILSLKKGLNMTNCEACLFNDIEETCDYGAWWYNAIPIDVVTADNLPLPIFIRGDDVEYGLRNNRHTIMLNGICVWHEPFENKYSSSMYYYIFRNRLIDNSVRSIDYTYSQLSREFLAQWHNEMKLFRYKNAKLLVDGICDYLRGIDWLLQCDGEELHNSIIGRGYKLESVDALDVQFLYGMYDRYLKGTIDNNRVRSRTKIVVVSAQDPKLSSTFGLKKVINYDYSTKKAFVTEYDKEEESKQKKYCKYALLQLRKQYSKIKGEYELRSKELTNIVFWTKYLSLE